MCDRVEPACWDAINAVQGAGEAADKGADRIDVSAEARRSSNGLLKRLVPTKKDRVRSRH